MNLVYAAHSHSADSRRSVLPQIHKIFMLMYNLCSRSSHIKHPQSLYSQCVHWLTESRGNQRILKIIFRKLWCRKCSFPQEEKEKREVKCGGMKPWAEKLDDLQEQGRKYDGEEMKRDWQSMRRWIKVRGRSKKSERSVSDWRRESIHYTWQQREDVASLCICTNTGHWGGNRGLETQQAFTNVCTSPAYLIFKGSRCSHIICSSSV